MPETRFESQIRKANRKKRIAQLVQVANELTAAVSGSVAVSSLPAALGAVTVTSGSLTAAVTGTVTSTPATITAAPSVTAVAISVTTNTTLMNANSSRKGAIIYNDCSAPLLVKLGTTASATDFSVSVAVGASYSLPDNVPSTRIDAFSTGSGTARVTEW